MSATPFTDSELAAMRSWADGAYTGDDAATLSAIDYDLRIIATVDLLAARVAVLDRLAARAAVLDGRMGEMADALLGLGGEDQAAIPGPIFGILGAYAVERAMKPSADRSGS